SPPVPSKTDSRRCELRYHVCRGSLRSSSARSAKCSLRSPLKRAKTANRNCKGIGRVPTRRPRSCGSVSIAPDTRRHGSGGGGRVHAESQNSVVQRLGDTGRRNRTPIDDTRQRLAHVAHTDFIEFMGTVL